MAQELRDATHMTAFGSVEPILRTTGSEVGPRRTLREKPKRRASETGKYLHKKLEGRFVTKKLSHFSY